MSKSHFARIIFFSVLASLLAFPGWLAAASPDDVTAIVIPSELPLTFVSATVESEQGRQLSTLHYVVKNTSKHPIQRFTVSAFLMGSTGDCLKGEGWTIQEKLPAGATRVFSTTLGNYVELGTRLAVTFASVADKASEMKIEAAQLRATLRQISAVDVIATRERLSMQTLQAYPSSNNTPGSCDPAFCTSARQDALATCLGENCTLSTFTCSQSACSYGFGCRCCTNGHCS